LGILKFQDILLAVLHIPLKGRVSTFLS